MGYNPRAMTVIAYQDTRGLCDRPRLFTEAILEGIAPGGGLFVPEELPPVSVDDLLTLARLPYLERAARVYEAFGLDVPRRDAAHRGRGLRRQLRRPAVAPVREVAPGRFVLELWHGPTLAFKDMALQCMPLFFSQALEQAHAASADDARLPHPGGDLRRHRRGGAERLRRPRPHAGSSSTTRTPACRRCRNGR